MKGALDTLVQGAEPFRLASTKNLYDAPPVRFLIDDVLPTHTICGLTGAPGTGKTWLAMEMMRAVVTGTKFLGQFAARQAPAIFVGSDASLLDYARQWRRLTRETYDSFEENQAENPFDSYAHFLIQSEFNLDQLDQIARLIKTSEQVEKPTFIEDVLTDEGWEQVEKEGRHYGLIIYDTLTKLTRTPENDSIGRDVVFEHLRDISEATGAALVVLHHPPLVSEFRSGEEFRGAGSQNGALDTHFHIVSENGRPDVVKFKYKKFRGITPKPYFFHLNVFDNENEALLAFMEPAKDALAYDAELMEDLIEVLEKRGNQPTSISEFAIALMQDPQTNNQYTGDVTKMKHRIRNFLKSAILKPNPPIVQIAVGRGNAGSLYKLTPKVEEPDDTDGSNEQSAG